MKDDNRWLQHVELIHEWVKEDKKEEADQLQRSKRYYAEGIQISGGMYCTLLKFMLLGA